MDQMQFTAMIPYIINDLAAMIAQKQQLSEVDAVTKLYDSKLYAMLENEVTKVWQYSTDMLYVMFTEEQQTGCITFPDV